MRTQRSIFKDLKEYPFKPNYLIIGDTRIHYLDEGPIDGEIIFLLHGEPALELFIQKK